MDALTGVLSGLIPGLRASLVLFLIVYSFVVTWLVTSYQFLRDTARLRKNAQLQKKADGLPAPVVPYCTPLLGDAIPAFLNPWKYVAAVFSKYGWRQPLRARLGPSFPTVIVNPEHIVAIFKNSKIADDKPGQGAKMQRMFGTSAQGAAYWDKDDSGVGLQPRKGSKVRPEHRAHLWGVHTPKTFLAGQHLIALNERFLLNLQKQLDTERIQEQWVEYPDLYRFVQSAMGRASTETVMGSKLLELNPNVLDDFYAYDSNLIKLMFGWPRWLAPRVYEIRDRIRAAMKTWHAEASKEAPLDADDAKIGPEDPEHDLYYGSKLIRAQRAAMMKMGLSADDAASMNVSLLFALNSNVLRTTFWMTFHGMRDAVLRNSLLAEAHECQRADGTFDIAALVQKPRLQSAFAEVCRYYVAIALPRVVKDSDLRVGDVTIKAGQALAILSRDVGFNDEAWAAAGRPQRTPLAEFEPERFLNRNPGGGGAATEEGKDSSLIFSLDRLAGCWLPFGGGQRSCPGRHFAKAEILAAFSMLFTRYELELLGDADSMKPDMRWYPIGVLLPTAKVPFRIRKRASS